MNYDELWIINANNAGEIHSFKFQMFHSQRTSSSCGKQSGGRHLRRGGCEPGELGVWVSVVQWNMNWTCPVAVVASRPLLHVSRPPKISKVLKKHRRHLTLSALRTCSCAPVPAPVPILIFCWGKSLLQVVSRWQIARGCRQSPSAAKIGTTSQQSSHSFRPVRKAWTSSASASFDISIHTLREKGTLTASQAYPWVSRSCWVLPKSNSLRGSDSELGATMATSDTQLRKASTLAAKMLTGAEFRRAFPECPAASWNRPASWAALALASQRGGWPGPYAVSAVSTAMLGLTPWPNHDHPKEIATYGHSTPMTETNSRRSDWDQTLASTVSANLQINPQLPCQLMPVP